jgi:hypothetical protein
MTQILGLDPGPYRSALVVYNGVTVLEHLTLNNDEMLGWLINLHGSALVPPGDQRLVIEQVAAMGMAVGAEVFTTVFWDGRFYEAWVNGGQIAAHLKRHEIKLHLCGSMRAKDANIRAALIDKFGGASAIGTKKAPGPLYGIHGDQWAALSVAVTWYERHVKAEAQPALSAVSE